MNIVDEWKTTKIDECTYHGVCYGLYEVKYWGDTPPRAVVDMRTKEIICMTYNDLLDELIAQFG